MLEDDIIESYIVTSRSSEEHLYNPYIKVFLSDEQIVYSKPGRRSWLELKQYLCKHQDIYITKLEFGFRDHTEQVHSGEADYFFTNSIIANDIGWYQEFYIGGYRDGDTVKCKKFMIPEIYLVEEDERPLDDHSVIRGLIRRNKCQVD